MIVKTISVFDRTAVFEADVMCNPWKNKVVLLQHLLVIYPRLIVDLFLDMTLFHAKLPALAL